MKNVLLLVSFLAIGFTSCNKDDDSSSAAPAALEGKWNFSKEGAIVGGSEMLIDYTGNESGCTKDYIMINTNGTTSAVDYDSFDSPCEMFTSNGNWTRSGNNLVVTFEGDSSTFEILNLTSSELKIKDSNGEITVFTRG